MLELITGVAISALILLVVSYEMTHLYREKHRIDLLMTLQEIRLSFQKAILNKTSWLETKANNPRMSCFSNTVAHNCSALNGMMPQEFKVFAGGQMLFDSNNPTSGFTEGGVPCSTYSASASGSASSCNLKPHLRWAAQCSLSEDPNCYSPLIVINLSIETSSSAWRSIDFDAFGFELSKSTFGIQLSRACVGTAPVCSPSEAAICEGGNWQCEEFGL